MPLVSERAVNAGAFVVLLADVLALLLFPRPLTAGAVIVVTGMYVLLTQFRELFARERR